MLTKQQEEKAAKLLKQLAQMQIALEEFEKENDICTQFDGDPTELALDACRELGEQIEGLIDDSYVGGADLVL